MKSSPIAAIFFMSAAIAAADEQSYLCVAEQSTGFSFKNGSWQSTGFKADDKYVIKPVSAEFTKTMPNAKWIVVPLGDVAPMSVCGEFNENGWLQSCGGFVQFSFNRKTLKFLSAYMIGYVYTEDGKENANTPSLTIGKCSPL